MNADPLDKQIDDAVEACRKAVIDLTVKEKTVVMERLRGWIELEAASHDPAAAKNRQH
jgi:hypothetical protein